MPVIIKVIALGGPIEVMQGDITLADQYVKSYDPDAFNGRGDVEVTRNPVLALHFKDAVDAWECWKKQSTVRPYRDDGKPNRPMTALTVAFETWEG